MKKKYLVYILLLVLCVTLVGCGKSKEKNEQKDGYIELDDELEGWVVDLHTDGVNIPEDALAAFYDAKATDFDNTIDAVALLGTQKGIDLKYMFLTIVTPKNNESKANYKILIVSKNANGESKIVSKNDFDLAKYVNKNISGYQGKTASDWVVNKDTRDTKLNEEFEPLYYEAIDKIYDYEYRAITLIASQKMSEDNYAVLCLENQVLGSPNYSIKLLTIHVDSEKKAKVTSTAFIDLVDLDK